MANYECFEPCSRGIFHATNANGSWVVTRVHRSIHDVSPSLALGTGPAISFRGATGDGDSGFLHAWTNQGTWYTRLGVAATIPGKGPAWLRAENMPRTVA